MNSRFAHFASMARTAAWSSLAILLYWMIIANLQLDLLALQARDLIETIAISPILVVSIVLLSGICVLAHRRFSRIFGQNISYVAVGLILAAVLVILILYFPLEYPLSSNPDIVSIIVTFILPVLAVLAANLNWIRTPFQSPDVTQHAPKHHEPRRSEADIERLLSTISTEPHGNVRLAVSAIRLRAHSMMHRATGILYVIIAVLIVTALFIVFAGKIAEIGINRFDPLAELNAERTDLQERVSWLRDEQVSVELQAVVLTRQLADIKSKVARLPIDHDDFTGFLLQSMDEQTANLQGGLKSVEVRKSQVPLEIGLIENRLVSLDNAIDRARSDVLSAMIGKVTDRNKGGLESITDTELLVAASLTRVGVLVVAIYLVQILVQLYRYNTRLAENYFAHADALLLRKHLGAEDHKALQDALHPDVPYGKEPKPFWQRKNGRGRGIFGRRKSDQSSPEQEESGE